MDKKQAREIVMQAKADLGERLVILGHHYQHDDIIQVVDYVGDSLELARTVPYLEQAEIIVFCGVFFMAETASILAPQKRVLIPDRNAGCPMADMAPLAEVAHAWEFIADAPGRTVPVTYVNSSAEIKAFCGRHGGTVCTSGNAEKVLKSVMQEADRVFFMPDRNLGRNTACKLGLDAADIVEWDPAQTSGGLSADDLGRARMVLWKGWCPVHWPALSADDVRAVRRDHPGIRTIVHPEADPATVAECDLAGSTAQILEFVKGLSLGDRVAIGTEYNMVNRIADNFHEIVRVLPIRQVECDGMGRITLPKLAECLLNIDSATNEVKVEDGVAVEALLALDRMLRI